MAKQKIRYTLWIDEETLKAAKARAAEECVSPSRIIVAVARRSLVDAAQNSEARILQAVERVFHLLQRIDRRRGYDDQVLKEMVGLMVQSFFNHTPAIPEKDKKAALYSGKARFSRYLDTLAANLRAGQSILNDLPAPSEPASRPVISPGEVATGPDSSAPNSSAGNEAERLSVTDDKRIPSPHSPAAKTERKAPVAAGAGRWGLFG